MLFLPLLPCHSNFDDPDDVAGMAHFIEHMIFMGSKKYPKENEYDTIFTRHGGSNNAETDAETTCFYFDVPLPGLEQVLDIFSNLFYEPLFLEDTIDREVNAIDSEFDQARQSNDVRCDSVLAQFLNGPAKKFAYGNRESLLKVGLPELQKRAREFWLEHYQAQWMYLAIQAKMPLDELEALVEKHFAKLKGTALPPMQQVTHGRPREYQKLSLSDIFQPGFTEQAIHVEAIDNKIELILNWPVPSQLSEFRCKPAHFIEQLLENEGAGGLITRLKGMHLIQRADAQINGDGSDHNSMFSLFSLTMRLSKNGHKNIPLILENVQSYLRMLQTQEDKWQPYYEQLKEIFDSQFRFLTEPRMTDELMRLTTTLRNIPEERVLDGNHLYFEYDKEMVRDLLNCLVEKRPGIMICSPQNVRMGEEGETLVEYYTQAKYTLQPIPEEWKRAFSIDRSDPRVNFFSFMPPNEFVTTDFSLVAHNDGDGALPEHPHPRKIAETELYELWYKADHKFGLPRLCVNLQLILPLVFKDIRNTVLLDIFGNMLSRELVKVLYAANVAGYGCFMDSKALGVSISMNGFSQRLPAILSEVLAKLNEGFGGFACAQQFELTKEELLCSYVNALLYVDGLTAEVLNGVVEDGHFSAYDKFTVLHSVSYEDLGEFCGKLFKELRMKCLVQGNTTEEGAKQFVQMIVDSLGPAPVERERRKALLISAVELPRGEMNSIRVAAFNKTDVNSSFCQYYEVGPETVELHCSLQLLLMIMEEPLFHTLRTKKQLGYEVGATIKYNNGLLGFCVSVVSQESKFTLEEVEAEVNDFVLEEFAMLLEDLEEEDFEESRSALLELKGMPDQDLEEEVQRNWGEIRNGTYRFDRLEREREWLGKCTRDDIIQLYEQILSEERRQLLVVQVKGSAAAAASAAEVVEEDLEKKHDYSLQLEDGFTPIDGGVVKDIAEFKGRCTRYVRSDIAGGQSGVTL